MTRIHQLVGLITGWFLTSSSAFAQEEAAAAPASKVGIFDAISQGGTIGFVIIGISVVAGTLIVEHFMSIKREKLAPPEVIDEVEELMNAGNYQEVLEYCETDPCMFTNIVAAGVRRIGYPFSAMEKSIEEMEDEESIKLHQKIGYLSLIAGISPMMGLFGTVTGMVGAFGTIASQASVEPRDFAGDIQLALVTTVLGLTVAIPVTAFFVFFRNRVTMLSMEIGAIVEEMFDRFRPTE
jgi:biopolymer transport protein ExbB